MTKLPLLLDDREPKEVKFDLDQYFNVQVMRLQTGDIMIPGKSSACIIERKTPNDFLSSIADGRLMEQLGKMLQSTEAPIVIVSGDVKCNRNQKVVADGRYTRWNYWSYQGMVASLQLAGAIVIHVPERLFGESVHRLYQWQQKDSHLTSRRVPGLGFKTTFSQQVELLTAIPGIGEDKAEQLLDKFGNPWNVMSNIPDWGTVSGIGPKTIEKVLHFMDYDRNSM